VRDATSGVYLPLGSGTPGLIWRGQVTVSSTAIGGTAGVEPINLPGAGGTWDLPLGYRYDTEVCLTVRGGTVGGPGGHTTGDLIVLVQGSVDLGATWTVTLLSRVLAEMTLFSQESRCFQLGAIAGIPLSTTINYVRTCARRIGSSTDAVVIADSWTKITQYVT